MIEAVVGDITTAPCEAIVNAANSELWMGGGVAGAINRAAGSRLSRRVMVQGPIQPGEAVVSAGAVL